MTGRQQDTDNLRALYTHGVHSISKTDNPRASYTYGVRITQATDNPRAAYTLRGPHQASNGAPTWNLHATGLTPINSRITRVRRTRYGVHISQGKEYPRAACALRGSHKSSQEYPRVSALRGPCKSKHGLPTWSASYGVYTSQSTDYSRKQRIHWPNK